MVLERWAYGDESGTTNSTFCTVGGFISSPRQWEIFRRHWRAALDAEGVTTFHAAEFFQRAGWKSSRSPYHDWTPGRAQAFIESLLYVIRDRLLNPIGGPVNVADFGAMHPDMRRLVTGASVRTDYAWVPGSRSDPMVDMKLAGISGSETYPYFAAFNLFIDEALTRTPPGAKLHFVMDRHNVYEGYARAIYDERIKVKAQGWEKMGDLIYAVSSDHAELQIADLYVYVLNGWVTRSGNVSHDRRTAAQAFFKKRSKVRVQNAESFENMLRETDAEILKAISDDLLRGLE